MGRRRFKRYKFALQSLINPDTGASSNPAAGTALANYQEYASGAKKITYTRAETSKPGEIVRIAINPFALPLNTANLVKVPYSKRTQDATTVNTVETACNHSSADGVLLELNRFVPAKAIVSVPSGATAPSTNPKSQITGVPYVPSLTNSYTFPYGQKTGELTESEVRGSILTAVDAIAGATVSFNSEEF